MLINVEGMNKFSVVDDEMKAIVTEPTHKGILKLITNLLYKYVKGKKPHKDKYDAESINFNDRVNRIFINTIFPSKIDHYDNDGTTEREDLFGYFSTHFNLADERTTPRMIQLFISKALNISLDYHKKNNYLTNEIKQLNHQYPIIKREAIRRAYADFQNFMWDNILNNTPSDKWKTHINKIRNKIDNNIVLNYESLKKIVGKIDNNELMQLLAYLCHVRVLKCADAKIEYYSRQYTVPVVFRKIYPLPSNCVT